MGALVDRIRSKPAHEIHLRASDGRAVGPLHPDGLLHVAPDGHFLAWRARRRHLELSHDARRPVWTLGLDHERLAADADASELEHAVRVVAGVADFDLVAVLS